jgi:3-dehydroquinate synthase
MSQKIPVTIAERSYDIHVGPGLLAHAGTLIKPFARGVVPIVADEDVARLHLESLLSSLRHEQIEGAQISVPPGESTKSFTHLASLVRALLASGVDRGGLIIAFGGGVVGDLVGFAAGIAKRGIDFVQIPTTLLAQVDSSVGGKTAINVPEGKNLVGLFHQPKLVIADTSLLKTLPKRQLLAGYAEVAKYGALGDANFFAWLERHANAALTGDEAAIAHAVAHSCRMKAEIVARDERETGERALLNFGHTFGHALEAATGYSDRLLHGEGVAIGIALAFELSVRLGHCDAKSAQRVRAHLESVGLPVSIGQIQGDRPDPETVLAHMEHDKKARGGKLTFVLAKRIGETFLTQEVSRAAILELLAA